MTTTPYPVRVSVPGKVMLAGEYAVLFGAEAVAATLDLKLTVEVKAALGQHTEIHSDLWKNPVYLTSDCTTTTHEPLVAMVEVAQNLFGKAPIVVNVRSELRPEWGIGSSSALRLAVSTAIQGFYKQCIPDAAATWDLAELAWQEQRRQQKRASGYDIATQCVGGAYVFQTKPNHWPSRGKARSAGCLNHAVRLFIGGKGAPTANVMGGTLQWLEDKGLTAELINVSDQLVEAWGKVLSHSPDWQQLFLAIKHHRRFFQGATSHSFPAFNRLKVLPGLDESWSFKTTGAGGEDALLLIGEADDAASELRALGWDELPARFADQGTLIEFVTRDS